MNQKETDVNLSIDNGKGTHHSKRDNIDFFNIYYLFLKDRKKMIKEIVYLLLNNLLVVMSLRQMIFLRTFLRTERTIQPALFKTGIF